MSSKQHEPGTIAMVTALNQPKPWPAYFDGDVWQPIRPLGVLCVHEPTSIRPMLVIDPQADHHVDRLAAILERSPARVRAALRGLANPTPDEPPPWSVAVVAGNTPFVRMALSHITRPYSTRWFGQHPTTGETVRLSWADLHALGSVEVVGRGTSDDG